MTPVTAGRARPAHVRRRRRFSAAAPSWLFAAPALAVYALIVLYPAVAGVVYAFTDWSGIGRDMSFVGLENFRTLLADEQAMGSIGNTLLLTVAIVVVQNGVGLLLALGVHVKLKSRALLRVIFFAPVVVSPVMVAFLWKYIYNPDPSAGLNGLLGLHVDWLGDPSIALWSIAGMVVWQNAGYSMVIFLAGLEGVPRELHEAAMIDGAGTGQRFRYVTWPLLAPALTINLMLSTIGGLKLFDQVFAATNGGPGYATETLSTVLYKQAFVFGKFGYSTAVALVLALFVAAVSLIQVSYLRSREVAV
ncbi:ABC-type sugar transport system, permease component [[Actinomadura] parvosata subsp. kistnae]|uniref:Sugar ABC transporter permease n=2 Tax=Nonomuraea TaxID=83681 RepID=A0A1U9ZTV4_9ACTN|nr:sugar ABC transporter permease [Nonomuraea sp. ATCC 55076]AQZ61374.1 sugar ABC transporter permease [Nonomuraea sp. ATCC 55076]NJP88411.1 sugar ABC transporter permease [Nonomuraea sp. FMUSA5-5]SPL98044.1 ABC-type sugar transport system, permease component [Actinomadura parvosata subsp. kistnae]